MNCKCGCGQEVEEKPGGHRQRLFVDDAHKMRYRRRQQQDQQNAVQGQTFTAMLAELAELREHVAELEAENADLFKKAAKSLSQSLSDAQQIAELQKTLDKERKDRESYQEQASEIALTWMHENSRLKTELERLEHHYRLARQFQDDMNRPTEEDQTIKELQAQVTDLQQRIENEKNFLSDTKARYFKSWLKKQPSSPWRIKLLSDQLVPARGTHAHYLAHLKRLQMDEEALLDFMRLWKLFVFER